ncbi:MAG: thermonuclease family protein [Pseudomonadota bacterium]
MRVRLSSVTLLLLVGLAACAPEGADRAGNADAPFTAKKVFDGDSLIVSDSSGQDVELRLFGIDAPERGQAYSNKARQALGALVDGARLRLELIETDRYGRQVVRLYRADERDSVNAQMVQQGFAWVYRRYSQDAAMLALEDDARTARRGLWADRATPVAPWDWRRDRRDR